MSSPADTAIEAFLAEPKNIIVAGIRTNIDLHKALLSDPEVIEGTMTTRTVERVTGRAH